MRAPLTVIWDNPQAAAEFPRGLAFVVELRARLEKMPSTELIALRSSWSGTREGWKVEFIDHVLFRRAEARRVLGPDLSEPKP